MRRIHPRATKSSTCRMSIGFSKPSTSPSPMADQTFRLPDLGEGLTEAQLVTWRVKEGGHVEVNEPLCDVETAKAVVVIPSPWAGTIQKLHARPGESVAVGAALVTITGQGAPTPVAPRPAEAVEATPGTLVGYGPGAGPQAGSRRRARVAPSAQQAGGAFPMMNSSWDESRDEIIVKEAINVGIAVNTNQGLLVPVLRGADQLDLVTLAAQSARLIEGARAGTLKPGEMTGGTITVTNVGASGPVETGTPIISPPECCVVAFGAIKPRPMVVDGHCVARPGARLSISVDHPTVARA